MKSYLIAARAAVDYGVNAAVYRRLGRAEIPYLRLLLVFCGGNCLVDKLRYAFPLRRAYGNNRYAEKLTHFLDVDSAAVCVNLVHHVEGKHHRHAKLEKLQG